MDFYLYFILIFCFVILAILLIILAVNKINKSSICNNQRSINAEIRKTLSDQNFEVKKIFYLNDYASCDQPNSDKKQVLIDNKNKKVCFVDYSSNKLIIVEFHEILNYELYENGSTQINGVGFGGLTRLSTAQADGLCKDLKLIIRLKKLENAQVTYEIIGKTPFNRGVLKTSSTYHDCIASVQEFISFLEVIKDKNKKNS